MGEPVRCRSCGRPLDPPGPGGLCPVCLLSVGMQDTAGTEAIGGDTGSRRPESGSRLSESGDRRAEAADVPSVIGPYHLLQVLGEGGMGLVYLAEQREPLVRRVALKLIKPGMDTREVLGRFEAERQALALMDHPHIARVLDAGLGPQQRPYFVMEYVAGVPITAYCDRHRLRNAERLQIFLQVCTALQHAHQKGIIHRDLKPSNILVTMQDGKPVPKVIDFGIAKATHQTSVERVAFTQLGMLMGTPEYISPEQAEASGLEVDTTTDIYSLGVVLYELLTGVLPFDGEMLRRAGYVEMHRIIREQDPPKPSLRVTALGATAVDIARQHQTTMPALGKQLRGDLDAIAMKAMEKDRTRRYASASEFAADITRYLNGEPVVASPPSVVYRTRKFVRRHKVGVAAATLVILSLVAGLTLSTVFYVRSESARTEAESQRTEAEHQRAQTDAERRGADAARTEAERQRRTAEAASRDADRQRAAAEIQRDDSEQRAYRSSLLAADLSLEKGDFRHALEQLQFVDPKLRGWEWRYLQRVSDVSVATTAQLGLHVRDVAFSTRGAEIFARVSPLLESRDSPDRSFIGRFTVEPGRLTMRPVSTKLRDLAISPDGKYVVSIAWGGLWTSERTACSAPENPSARAVCTASAVDLDGKVLGSVERGRLVVSDAASGAAIATVQHPNIATWTAPRFTTGRLEIEYGMGVIETGVVLENGNEIAKLSGGVGEPVSVVFGPDGTRFATWSWDNVIHIWDVHSHALVASLSGHRDAIMSVAFTGDMKRLVSGSVDGTARVWDVESGRQLSVVNYIGLTTLAISRNGRHVAIGHRSGPVDVWDTNTSKWREVLLGHTATVTALGFSPDSEKLASGAADGSIRLWDVASGSGIGRMGGGLPGPSSLAFSPDGQLLASGSFGGIVRVWSARGPVKVLDGHDGPVDAVGFTANRDELISVGWDGSVRAWDTRLERTTRTLKVDPHDPQAGREASATVAMTPDGRYVALTSGVKGTHSGTRIESRGTAGEIVSPGSWRVHLLDVRSGNTTALHMAPADGAVSGLVAVSGDGRRLASISSAGTLQMWQVPSGAPVGATRRQHGVPMAIALTGTGDRVAVGLTPSTLSPTAPERSPGSIVVLDMASDRVLATIHTPATPSSLAFTPDGTRLVCGFGLPPGSRVFGGGVVGWAAIYDVRSGQRVATLTGNDEIGVTVAVSLDGTRVVTGGMTNQTLRIWDARRYDLLLTIRASGALVSSLAMSADGERIATGTGAGVIYVWDARASARDSGELTGRLTDKDPRR